MYKKLARRLIALTNIGNKQLFLNLLHHVSTHAVFIVSVGDCANTVLHLYPALRAANALPISPLNEK